MKVNNNLNLKQAAQTISKSIVKYHVLNNEEILLQIQNEILNKAKLGEKELNIYLRKMPKTYYAHRFANPSIVIDLDEYPTTTMEEVYDELTKWLQIQGFLPQDILYTPPRAENFDEPIIATVTVKW